MKNREKELELYLHIPFCVRKCYYCDFLSFPATEKEQRAYASALIWEMKKRAKEVTEYHVSSIFIGGGTPSAIPSDCLAEIIKTVKSEFRLDADAEITMEVNPGTGSRELLQTIFDAGVNRLSIGLQTIEDELLKRIGRIHTLAQFEETYYTAVEVGFTNINVDIMSTLPGQTREGYLASLEYITGLQPAPKHISAYSLILEEGTKLYEEVCEGKLQEPDEDTDRAMYHDTVRFLQEKGYERYEISNYAKDGYACKHNCGYWQRKNYLGFGIGAASLLDNVRFKNGNQIDAYLANPLNCREEIQKLSTKEQMEEFLFLGLRMTEGISREDFRTAFGIAIEEIYGNVIDKNKKNGLLHICENGNRLALTKKGLDLANYVMQQFLF